ncbi:hypothetical protein [Peptostreptococcus equinus]|uniref:Uncharacterized protein n=1 Tax=Peptostreptococcus equinus TaxID=3003601 RepID=A0ABY7JNU7_9FIRM|nr:hypothetical protein [Peptostreptococcus sp. CBA3647]WAW14765.1 hypothetical protein O0R46_09295 [Peptostreptococcus sp. CBA3647]
MDIVSEYLKNLKRLDDGIKYFESLSDEEYKNIESSKAWKIWLDIWSNCERLYPLAKKLGCKRVFYEV